MEAGKLPGQRRNRFASAAEPLWVQAIRLQMAARQERELAKGEDKKSKARINNEPKYHVYVRLPFNRGDFVDPPPIDWDEAKSEALWSIISGVAKTEIDWSELATRFGVTVEFLLQMASYLTERHTSQLRAQMRKAAATKGSSAASPVPGAEPTGLAAAEAMRRTASGGGRAPSSLSIRKDAAPGKNEGTVPGGLIKSALRPQISRDPSTNTIVTGQTLAARRRLSSLPITTTAATPEAKQEPLSPEPAESSSGSSSSSSPVESRIIRRPPRFQPTDGAGSFADDDEAEPAFLPFKAQSPVSSKSSQATQDLASTLRGEPRGASGRTPKATGKEPIHHSQTSDSSSSSAAMVTRRTTSDRKPGPLSPRRTAELAGRSSSGKSRGYFKEGSDPGTPSMGSSFSDLDDASVTQSALEEALASKMQDGGTIGSRMSTISQAIRSRYLPKSNQP